LCLMMQSQRSQLLNRFPNPKNLKLIIKDSKKFPVRNPLPMMSNPL
jgi:hypothetical protein